MAKRKCGTTTWLRLLVAVAVALTIGWNWKILRHSENFGQDLKHWGYERDAPGPVRNRAAFRQEQPRPSLAAATRRPQPTGEVASNYWNCTPSHKACEDYQGILHIESGDFGGAGGTIFFQFVVGQLIYADQHNLLPFVHFDYFSHLIYDEKVHGGHGYRATFRALGGAQVTSVRDPRMYHAIYPGPPAFYAEQSPSTFTLLGTGVWNHYFHPVSDFCPGDLSCAIKPLVKMERAHVSPGLHVYAPWAPKIWRYSVMPDHMGQPHIPLTEWVIPQRKQASDIVQKYYQFQPSISDQTNIEITQDCLGLHVRWSDKGVARRRLGLAEFLPFVQAYVQAREATNTRVCIYLATDAQQVVEQVRAEWPESIRSRLILSQATVRSPDETAVFDMDSHHLTNLEVLRDILELSRCGFLLHGNSAVSESAIYLHSDLIYQSVNLEDPQHPLRSPRDFEEMVYNVSRGDIDSTYWNEKYQLPRKWWEPQDIDSAVSTCNSSTNGHVSFDLSSHWMESFMPINRWTTRVFVKFWQQLAKDGNVVVDPMWPSWFQRQTCVFKFVDLDLEFRDTIKSLASEVFFDKRFKPIVQEEDAGVAIRRKMHRVLTGLLMPRRHILQRADTIFNTSSARQRSSCLGVHIPDPGYRRKDGKWARQKYPQAAYHDYIAAFAAAGGTCLYLTTDSYSIWETFVETSANSTRTASQDFVVFTQSDAVRNRHHQPAHFMEESTQRLGSETLVDIWNLQRCGILIHGYSPISEAALFWNPHLKNIMMPDRKRLENFTDTVRSLLINQKRS